MNQVQNRERLRRLLNLTPQNKQKNSTPTFPLLKLSNDCIMLVFDKINEEEIGDVTITRLQQTCKFLYSFVSEHGHCFSTHVFGYLRLRCGTAEEWKKLGGKRQGDQNILISVERIVPWNRRIKTVMRTQDLSSLSLFSFTKLCVSFCKVGEDQRKEIRVFFKHERNYFLEIDVNTTSDFLYEFVHLVQKDEVTIRKAHPTIYNLMTPEVLRFECFSKIIEKQKQSRKLKFTFDSSVKYICDSVMCLHFDMTHLHKNWLIDMIKHWKLENFFRSTPNLNILVEWPMEADEMETNMDLFAKEIFPEKDISSWKRTDFPVVDRWTSDFQKFIGLDGGIETLKGPYHICLRVGQPNTRCGKNVKVFVLMTPEEDSISDEFTGLTFSSLYFGNCWFCKKRLQKS